MQETQEITILKNQVKAADNILDNIKSIKEILKRMLGYEDDKKA